MKWRAVCVLGGSQAALLWLLLTAGLEHVAGIILLICRQSLHVVLTKLTLVNERCFKTYNHSLSLSTVEEVLLRSIRASNMSAMLLNVSLRYIEDHLYCNVAFDFTSAGVVVWNFSDEDRLDLFHMAFDFAVEDELGLGWFLSRMCL